MNKSTQIALVILSVFLFTFCGQSDRAVQVNTKETNNHKVEILEVLQSNSYTYFYVKEGFKDFWIVTSKTLANVGEEVYYAGGFEMLDFPSKELDRTFDKIIFVNSVSDKPVSEVTKPQTSQKANMASPPKPDINVEPAENGISLSELFTKMNDYNEKKVIVRGKVVKFSANIMDKNWIHIQDGTEFDGKFDLTVTSQEVVNIEDIVTFEGTIFINKDFGSGYFYDIIMEEAVIVK